MKKIFSLVFALLIICSFASCNSKNNSSEVNSSDESEYSIDTDTVIDTQTIGNWEITIHSAEETDLIRRNSISGFQSKEDKKFIVIGATVKNLGTAERTFLTRMVIGNSEINTKLVYNENEYSASELFGYDFDLCNSSFLPSDSKTGIIAFEVPEDIADNYKDAELVFKHKDNSCSFSLE